MRFKTLILAASGLLAFQSSQALTLFDQTTSLNYDPNASPTAATSDLGVTVRAATFNIGSIGNQTAGFVIWYGLYLFGAPVATDDFTIALFTDSSGQPSASPFASFHVGNVSRTSLGTTVDIGGGTLAAEFKYETAIPDTAILQNTNYWIAIYNAIPGDEIRWALRTSTTGSGNLFSSSFPGDSPIWEPTSHKLAIAITSVPEPSCILLMGAVSLASCVIRRRKAA